MKARFCIASVVLVMVVLSSLLLANSPLLAQEPQSSTTVFQKTDLSGDIQETTRTYQGQLAEYREAEQQFTIAKGQFQNLNTLSSLEAAVEATKKMMMLRDQVMETYLVLLRLHLLSTEGIKIEYRDLAVERIETLSKALRRHREAVSITSDRAGVQTQANEFELIVPVFVEVSQFSSSLLKVGQLQSVYDHSVSLTKTLDAYDASASATAIQSQRRRGIDQTADVLLQAKQGLAAMEVKLIESLDRQGGANLAQEFNQVFAALSQAITFLTEITTTQL